MKRFGPFSKILVTKIVERLNKDKSTEPDVSSKRIFSPSIIEQIKKPIRNGLQVNVLT